MTITVSSGLEDDGLSVSSGNPLVVLSGGYVEFTDILSGGSATLSLGAEADNTTVLQGGVLQGPGDVAGDTEVFGSANGLTVSSVIRMLSLPAGGHPDTVNLQNDGLLQIQSGGRVTNTEVAAGAEEIIFSGGSASGDIVLGYGVLWLNGGSAVNERVLSAGTLNLGGDLKSSLTIDAAPESTESLFGVQVQSGAFVNLANATVESGATLTLSDGVEVIGLTVSKGATVSGSGDLFDSTLDAGAVSGLALEGDLEVSSGGTATSVTDFGGEIQIDAGGSATGTTVSFGSLFDHGSATDTMVDSTGLAFVYAGGVTSGDTVLSGAEELVSSGGLARSIHVKSGGLDYVRASGTTSASVVSVGGKELVSSGGVASAPKVLSGGAEDVLTGGVASNANVSGSGKLIVSEGGTVIGLSLASGGTLIDNGEVKAIAGATLAGTLSGSGELIGGGSGDLLLSGAGAAFTGDAILEHGTIELATSGALGAGYVQFVSPATGSAVLQIDAADTPAGGGTFANLLSNFSGANEFVDLTGLVWEPNASATVVGDTLVLIDGAQTYTFDLAGSIAGAYPVLEDDNEDVLIDPRGIGPKAVAHFAQAAAAFAPSDAAKTALVSSASPAGQSPFLHAIGSAGAGR